MGRLEVLQDIMEHATSLSPIEAISPPQRFNLRDEDVARPDQINAGQSKPPSPDTDGNNNQRDDRDNITSERINPPNTQAADLQYHVEYNPDTSHTIRANTGTIDSGETDTSLLGDG